MTDRDCDNCAHHSEGGCSVWECSFEPKEDDTISRQAAIDTEGLDEQIRCEMCKNPMHTDRGCDGHCKYDEKLYERIMQILDERIKPLPSAQSEPQWIPVSERLPEEAYPVIVTWKNDDPASYYQFVLGKHYTGAAHYKNGKWFWYSSITEDVIMEYGRCDSEEFDEAIKVLAWMPLPEPYREEGERK